MTGVQSATAVMQCPGCYSPITVTFPFGKESGDGSQRTRCGYCFKWLTFDFVFQNGVASNLQDSAHQRVLRFELDYGFRVE